VTSIRNVECSERRCALFLRMSKVRFHQRRWTVLSVD